MMKCKKCGNELPENAKFCFKCGEKVIQELTCINCGAKMPADYNFCMECGTPIGNASQTEGVAAVWDDVETDFGTDFGTIFETDEEMCADFSDVYQDGEEENPYAHLSPYALHSEYYHRAYSNRICSNKEYIVFVVEDKCFLRNMVDNTTKCIIDNYDSYNMRLWGINSHGIFIMGENVGTPTEIYQYDFEGNLLSKIKFNLRDGFFSNDTHQIYIYEDYVVAVIERSNEEDFVEFFYFKMTQSGVFKPIYIVKREDSYASFTNICMDGRFIYYKAEYDVEIDKENGWYIYDIYTAQEVYLGGDYGDTKILSIYPEKGLMLTGMSKAECAIRGVQYSERVDLNGGNCVLALRRIGIVEKQEILYLLDLMHMNQKMNEKFGIDSDFHVVYCDGYDVYVKQTSAIGRKSILFNEIEVIGSPFTLTNEMYVTDKYVYTDMEDKCALIPKHFTSFKCGYDRYPGSIYLKELC